jgi:DtxR family transcriptional regulator, manganese transport regulator
MRKPSRIVGRHQRTRADHATETAEDYCEAVHDFCLQEGRCRVVDLALHFAVSHVTVTKIVKRLQREGYVSTQPYGPIGLTTQGAALAKQSRRRHQVVYDFLVALGVDEPVAMVDAEGIEHHVSPQTLAKFEEFTQIRKTKRTNTTKRTYSP